MQEIRLVRRAFIDPQEFWSSPLYRRLCTVVADDPFLIEIAAHARSGQGPTFAFFGAVHALLLGGIDDPLADYYPSLRGDLARAPDDNAGPALRSFAGEHGDALRELLRTRLVQTNHVQRAVGLRLGLAALADALAGEPVHLVEIGASAGLVVRHAAYGYRLGDRRSGDTRSPVQLRTEWRSTEPVPDLDSIPMIVTTTGIDLHPLDAGTSADRRWLEALVWPEDRQKATQLRAALDLAERLPVRIYAGDAVDLLPEWSVRLPPGEPRIVFHCATRMHVPAERRAAFDRAILDVNADGPLYRIAIEGEGIMITRPDQRPENVFQVDGHLAWAKPTDAPQSHQAGG